MASSEECHEQMGFRSTYISENWNVDWPTWFREKHSSWINDENMIVSPHEVKCADEIMGDVHKALLEVGWFGAYMTDRSYSIVGLHECGGITKTEIYKDKVVVGCPSDWIAEECGGYINSQYDHCYCYGCTDLRKYLEGRK